MTVETTSLSRADADCAHQLFESQLHRKLRHIAWQRSVVMEVSLSAHPAEVVDTSRIENIDSAAATVARTGARLTIARGWARLVVTPAAHDGEVAPGVTSFTGAVHRRDSWQRVRSVLRDKARQSVGAPDDWIRMDDLDGLFAMTDWARQEMSERVGLIAHAVSAALADVDHVHGVILSSRASINLDSPFEPSLHQRADIESATMMRRLIAPGLVRETAIVPLVDPAPPVAALFVQAYDAEADRFVDDLAERRWSLDGMRRSTFSGSS